MFPAGAIEVTGNLACCCEGEQVVYFHDQLPVFTHTKNDVASFRMFTSQLIVQGSAQNDLSNSLRVPIQNHWITSPYRTPTERYF